MNALRFDIQRSQFVVQLQVRVLVLNLTLYLSFKVI